MPAAASRLILFQVGGRQGIWSDRGGVTSVSNISLVKAGVRIDAVDLQHMREGEVRDEGVGRASYSSQTGEKAGERSGGKWAQRRERN